MHIRHTGNWARIAFWAIISSLILAIETMPTLIRFFYSGEAFGIFLESIVPVGPYIIYWGLFFLRPFATLLNDERTIQAAARGDGTIAPLARHSPPLELAETNGTPLVLRQQIKTGSVVFMFIVAAFIFFVISMAGTLIASRLLGVSPSFWLTTLLMSHDASTFGLAQQFVLIAPSILAALSAGAIVFMSLGRAVIEIVADDAGVHIQRRLLPRRSIPWSSLRLWLRHGAGSRVMTYWLGSSAFATRVSLSGWQQADNTGTSQADRLIATITARSQVPLREYGYRIVRLARKPIVRPALEDTLIKDLPPPVAQPFTQTDSTTLPFVLMERIPRGRFIVMSFGFAIVFIALGLTQPSWRQSEQTLGDSIFTVTLLLAFMLAWAFSYGYVLEVHGARHRRLIISRDLIRVGNIPLRWSDIQAWALTNEAKQRTYVLFTEHSTYSWHERITAEAPHGLTTDERRAAYQAQAETAHALIAQYSGKPLRVLS
jgi:hypothetical protein